MTIPPIYLIDPSSAVVGVLDVVPGECYRGTIDLSAAPPDVRRLFEEFEEYVEGQMFTLADELEEKIAGLSLRVVFANGEEAAVADLQVYPSTKRVSFKVPVPATR